MNRAEYRAALTRARLRSHALTDWVLNPYLREQRSPLEQQRVEREAECAYWGLPLRARSCEREHLEVMQTQYRRERVVELLRAGTKAQLLDTMFMLRRNPIHPAQRVP